jgi:hypothetical protein
MSIDGHPNIISNTTSYRDDDIDIATPYEKHVCQMYFIGCNRAIREVNRIILQQRQYDIKLLTALHFMTSTKV